jgi:hypothetical protein
MKYFSTLITKTLRVVLNNIMQWLKKQKYKYKQKN